MSLISNYTGQLPATNYRMIILSLANLSVTANYFDQKMLEKLCLQM